MYLVFFIFYVGTQDFLITFKQKFGLGKRIFLWVFLFSALPRFFFLYDFSSMTDIHHEGCFGMKSIVPDYNFDLTKMNPEPHNY